MASGHRVGEVSPGGTHVWDSGGRWEPLWLRPDQVAAAARACFGRTVAGPPRFLAEGMLNQSWQLDTPHGCCVLRVTRPALSREQVGYEHDVTRSLHRHVPEVVPPLPGRDGDTVQVWGGRLLSLFPFVDGVLGTGTDPKLRASRAAAMLARIHRVSRDLSDRAQRPGFRRADERPRWLWARVRPVLVRELGAADGFAEACAVFDRELSELDTWLDTLVGSGRELPAALIHGDFNPRNLIFAGDRLAGVIDWDGCHVDLLAWEVAQVACGSDVDTAAFWRTYLDAGGPLAERDLELLGGFARMGMLSEVQWTTDGGKLNPRGMDLVRELADGVTWNRDRHPLAG